MTSWNDELTLEEIMADPTIRLLRAADHVDQAAFERLLAGTAARVATSPRPRLTDWPVAHGFPSSPVGMRARTSDIQGTRGVGLLPIPSARQVCGSLCSW